VKVGTKKFKKDIEQPCSRSKNGVFSSILAKFADFGDFVRNREICIETIKNKDAIEDYSCSCIVSAQISKQKK